MSDNNKFLKEESIFLNNIKELSKEKKYYEIGSLRNEVFNNIDFYKKTNVIEIIISSLFVSRNFEELVTFITELARREIEKLSYSFYCIASLIALDDMYMAKSYVKKSKILNDSVIKYVITEDGANYSSIINEDINDIPCLLLLNYVYDFDLEGNDEKNLTMLKYYEMLDTIYSLNFSNEVIDYMFNIGKIIFNDESI